jgi:hypothetical protein
MLVRRILLFLVLLLAVTALSAGLAPPPRTGGGSGDLPDTPTTTSAAVERTIAAERARPATVTVEVGDLLRLTVRSPTAGAVELRGLGAVRAIAPETPVVFDVLPDVPGDYPVVLLGAERTLGTVRVRPRRE